MEKMLKGLFKNEWKICGKRGCAFLLNKYNIKGESIMGIWRGRKKGINQQRMENEGINQRMGK